MLTLLFIGTLSLTFDIQPVEASGTITIRADGSIDPLGAPINTTDMVTYYFTDNIYDEIVVERDNIVIDGAGYTLQGTGFFLSTGIDISGRRQVTIQSVKIRNFGYGIMLEDSSNNTILRTNIANNTQGIQLSHGSSNNTIAGNNNIISGNNITNNSESGISLFGSSNYNSINGNTITANSYGIFFQDRLSSNNSIYHNNFMNNTEQVYSSESTNTWDDGAGKGNYWSDYEERYPNATEIDGIWDTPYEIDADNVDRYPMVSEFHTWTSMLLILIVLTVAIAACKRRLLKTPIH